MEFGVNAAAFLPAKPLHRLQTVGAEFGIC
jgi:hypothetical protein